MNTMIW